MVLIRGFSKVDEDGNLAIPELIRRWTRFAANCLIDFRVMRFKDTKHQPYIYFFRSGHPPYISPTEVTMVEGTTIINKEGEIVLDDSILEEAKLELGHMVEMKVAGSQGVHWLMIYSRVRYSPSSVPLASSKKVHTE